MNQGKHRISWKNLWADHNTKIVFSVLLLLFMAQSLFFAFRLKTGIIPDEPAHFTFSQHFSTTLGIPPDTYKTYSWGWYIEQNPFLYYWINGRIINLVTFLQPAATDSQLLTLLRVTNVFYALGTLLFCYMLSREVIKHRWWSLVPVFLITQTLMFVFLSAGVNYDNLANLLSMAGLYFLIRVFNHYNFLNNSLSWMISIALGTLVKYPILPLALAMGIAWLVFTVTQRDKIFPLKFSGSKTTIAMFVLILLLIGNLSIYGVNLVRYQSLTPDCNEILLESQCEISPYFRRAQETANKPRLTISESLAEGFPNPIRYSAVDWVWNMLMRTYGIIGHQTYFPLRLISFYHLLFYWVFILSWINLLHWRRLSYINLSMLGIIIFYALVLLITNYQSELTYNFQQIALQGRYIFPVIGPIYILLTTVIRRTPIKLLRWGTLVFLLGLTSLGGSLTLLVGINTFLQSWFN